MSAIRPLLTTLLATAVLAGCRSLAPDTGLNGPAEASFGAEARGNLAAQPGQDRGQPRQPALLLAFAPQFPIGVIDILVTPGLIHAQGLDMRPRIGRDPHLAPGRRNAQRLDATARSGITDQGAIPVPITEAGATLFARQRQCLTANLDQPHRVQFGFGWVMVKTM